MLREFFPELLRLEGALEECRKEFSYRFDATAKTAFAIFASDENKVLSRFQLQDGLQRLGLTCSKEDALLVLDRYASEGEELTFENFQNMLLPRSPVFRADMLQRRPRKELSYDSRELLKRLLRQVIDAECEVESLRARVRDATFEEQRALFDDLDLRHKGFITVQELEIVYETCQAWLAQKSSHVKGSKPQLEVLISRMARVPNAIKVTLAQFLEEIRFKTPKFYPSV